MAKTIAIWFLGLILAASTGTITLLRSTTDDTGVIVFSVASVLFISTFVLSLIIMYFTFYNNFKNTLANNIRLLSTVGFWILGFITGMLGILQAFAIAFPDLFEKNTSNSFPPLLMICFLIFIFVELVIYEHPETDNN